MSMSNYVPNYTFLNIEDINTVIRLYGEDFDEYYDLDTTHLETNPTVPYSNYRYDFILVSKTISGSNYEYTLEIRNALWDGTYSFIRLPEGITPIVTQNVSNPNILKISGQDLIFFTIRLHLSNFEDTRVIESSNLKIKGVKNISGPYNETQTLRIQVTSLNDTPIAGATVNFSALEMSFNDITDNAGYCNVTIPISDAGKYSGIIYVRKEEIGEAKRSFSIAKTKADISDEIEINADLIKGAICPVLIKFDETADLIGTKATIEYLSKRIVTTVNERNEILFNVNLREIYDDSIDFIINLDETDNSKKATFDITEDIRWFVANGFDDLKAEVERPNGANVIRMEQGAYSATDTINVDRDLTIEGQYGESWATIIGDNVFDIFKEFTIKGIKMSGKTPISQEKGSVVNINGCLFENCYNNATKNIGTVIYQRGTSESKTNSKLFKLSIANTAFYNNIGALIQNFGQLTVDSCKVKVDSMQALYEPRSFFANSPYGEVSVYNSEFDVDCGFEISANNLAWSKNIIDGGSTVTFNGALLEKEDETLQIFGEYGNKSHIFLLYHYPYLEGAPVLVASPQEGKEAECACHCIASNFYSWKNGAQVERWNDGEGEYNDKKLFEIEIPTNGGVW